MRPVEPSAYVHLLFFGVGLPLAAIRMRKLIESRVLSPREKYFVPALLQVTVCGLFSVFVAMRNDVRVFDGRMPPMSSVLAGAAFLALAIPFGWRSWRKSVQDRDPLATMFMPTNSRERWLWFACAASAGVFEEITWRGVQTTLLTRLTASIPAAIALSIVMFAVAHAIQGWKSVGVIAVFAVAFHALVWLAGSLYVAIVVHFIYDLVAGLSYGYLGRVIPSVSEESGRVGDAMSEI